jgi:hypothetical protein
MRRALAKLVRRLLGVNPAPAAPPVAPEWTDEHQAVLLRFLASDAGQALWQRLRAVEADIASRAVQDVMHTSHSAGHAAGFADCRKWLESLSRLDLGATKTESEPKTDGQPAKDAPALSDFYASLIS